MGRSWDTIEVGILHPIRAGQLDARRVTYRHENQRFPLNALFATFIMPHPTQSASYSNIVRLDLLYTEFSISYASISLGENVQTHTRTILCDAKIFAVGRLIKGRRSESWIINQSI